MFAGIVIAGGLVFIGKGTKFEKIAGDGVQEVAKIVKIMPEVQKEAVMEFRSLQKAMLFGAFFIVKSWLAIAIMIINSSEIKVSLAIFQ